MVEQGTVLRAVHTHPQFFSIIQSWRRRGLLKGKELEILAPYRGRVPEEVFTQVYAPPKTDGSGNVRGNLRDAQRLLRSAGWEVDKANRKLTNIDYRSGYGLRNSSSKPAV